MCTKTSVIFAWIMTLAMLLSGCATSDSTPASTGNANTCQVLDTMMYCYTFNKGFPLHTYQAEMYAFVPPEGNEATQIELWVPLSDTSDFTYPRNGTATSVAYEEAELPYHTFTTHLYSPLTDGVVQIAVAIDFELQYMIMVEPAYYDGDAELYGFTVCAADPNVNPEVIYNHFLEFLRFFHYKDFDFSAME